MRKIKGQSKLTKLITSKMGLHNRKLFSKTIANINELKKLATLVYNDRSIDLQIVGFSSLKDYPEQILSILSFIRYVGVPVSWTIYSDGSHSEKELKNIRNIFPFVTIVKCNITDLTELKSTLQPFEKELTHFTKSHILGKRLFLYLNHKIEKPTLFLDSDILFYEKASILYSILNQQAAGWYLQDAMWGCLDSRYKSGRSEELDQVNAGFLIINSDLYDVSSGLNFLKKINFTYEYFSEQTIMHIISRSNNFKTLNSQDFVVDSADQFDFSYLYTPKNLAIRHYTGPVRHKMWQKDWKWHLSMV